MAEINEQTLSRKKIRQHICCLLYALSFYEEEAYDICIERYLNEQEITDAADRAYIRERACAVMAKRQEYDAMVDEKSDHWKAKRIARVDLAIIRLALYEMLEDETIPVSVAINEAVQLAKRYSSDASPAFVNGVLAQFADKDKED